MRTGTLVTILALALVASSAHANPPDISPAARTQYETADWAEWDAQARITQGDYDGATQAQQHAAAARRQADDLASRAPRRPVQANP
jgi:hypothetical protein